MIQILQTNNYYIMIILNKILINIESVKCRQQNDLQIQLQM